MGNRIEIWFYNDIWWQPIYNLNVYDFTLTPRQFLGNSLPGTVFRTFGIKKIMRCPNGFDDLKVTFYGGFFEIIFRIFCWPEVDQTSKRKLDIAKKYCSKITFGRETAPKLFFYYISRFLHTLCWIYELNIGENGEEIGIPILEFDDIIIP